MASSVSSRTVISRTGFCISSVINASDKRLRVSRTLRFSSPLLFISVCSLSVRHPHRAFLRWPGNCLVNILIVKPHGLFVKEKLHFCIDLCQKRIMFLCAVYDFVAFCGLRRCAHGFVL